MRHGGLTFALWLLGVLPLAVCGFATFSSATLKRSLSQRVSLTNSPILVMVSFTNNVADELRGFFFTEQVPSSLSVTTLSVTLNGRGLTNYFSEAGVEGDVLPGYTPWRWGIERPPGFTESNAIAGQSSVQILYALSCNSTGIFSLPGCSWAARQTTSTNTFFGYGEDAERRLVRFVGEANLPLAVGQQREADYAVTIDGAPGAIYLLSASTDLVTWVPVATNLSPFLFVETNWTAFPRRFYRAAPFLNMNASFALGPFSEQGLLVRVDGVTGCSYLVERSTNLVDWLPVATNLAPFNYIDPNTAGLPACFYRGRLLYDP